MNSDKFEIIFVSLMLIGMIIGIVIWHNALIVSSIIGLITLLIGVFGNYNSLTKLGLEISVWNNIAFLLSAIYAL